MPLNTQIMCINKTDRMNPHERIRAVGGVHEGARWWLPLDQAIATIRDGTHRYWTSANGKSVWVIIAKHNGNEYLKTESDGDHPNNLLALSECP